MRISIGVYVFSRRNSIKFLSAFRAFRPYAIVQRGVNTAPTFASVLIASKCFTFQKCRRDYRDFFAAFSTMCLNLNQFTRYTLIPKGFKRCSDSLMVTDIINIVIKIIYFIQAVSFFTLEFPYFVSLFSLSSVLPIAGVPPI